MIVFLAVALGGSKGGNGDPGCILLGVLLHYSVLASFCWMLVSAFLQILRFVLVLKSRPAHLLLKGAILSWGSPLVPVVTLLSIGPSTSYPAEIRDDFSEGFCYPRGLALILAVIVPVAAVVLTNLVVFSVIVYRVSFGRDKSLHLNMDAALERVMAIRQLRMSILLFFLLGLSWIFGLLALMASGSEGWSMAFAFLFCITSTAQGLALFLFFVVWEQKVRALWLAMTPVSKWFTSGLTCEVVSGVTVTPSTATTTEGVTPSQHQTQDEEMPLRLRNPEPNVKTEI